MRRKGRPEHTGDPTIFYDRQEARKYDRNSRIRKIQHELTMRSLELLALPAERSCFILDVGCGSGLSGAALSEAGHTWVGLDVSSDMLDIATQREATGDVVMSDMGQGVPFRSGVFDGAISISAVQWLCYSVDSSHIPRRRLICFFRSLYNALKRGARAVLQVYPESPEQLEIITNAATQTGFTGGVVVDYPNSAKAKKYYLCLFAGTSDEDASAAAVGDASRSKQFVVPSALGVPEAGYVGRGKTKHKHHHRKHGKKPAVKSKNWILAKKERQRRQGRKVRKDTKYSGRRRPNKF